MMIVMVVIVILTVLGTVSFSGFQVDARNKERASDIAAIQRGLEGYYKYGNPYLKATSGQGSYPGANVFIHIMGWDWNSNSAYCTATFITGKCFIVGGYPYQVFTGTNEALLQPPDKSVQRLSSTWLVANGNANEILNPGIISAVQNGQYIYKPMLGTSTDTCYDSDCPRYALIYQEEGASTQTIVKSVHQ